jgi:hypothetical protein
MPRKPRIKIAGYYHIINRGVEQRVVFKEASDYEYFEELGERQERGQVIMII